MPKLNALSTEPWTLAGKEIAALGGCSFEEYADEAAWLEGRKQADGRVRVGASEAACLLNLCPEGWRMTPLRLYAQKTGAEPADDDEEEYLLVGRAEEPVIAELAARQLGWSLITPPPYCIATRPAFPSATATVDRFLRDWAGGIWILELKTAEFAGVREWELPEEEDDHPREGRIRLHVPLHVQVQVQQQMAVTGIHQAKVALKVGRKLPELFDVAWNPDFFPELYAAIEQFVRCVETRKPPAASSSDLKVIAQLIGPPKDKSLDLGAEGLKLFAEWDASRAAKSKAEEEIDAIKVRVAELLGNATIGLAGSRKMTWKEQVRVTQPHPAVSEVHALLAALADGKLPMAEFQKSLPESVAALAEAARPKVWTGRVMLPPGKAKK